MKRGNSLYYIEDNAVKVSVVADVKGGIITTLDKHSFNEAEEGSKFYPKYRDADISLLYERLQIGGGVSE